MHYANTLNHVGCVVTVCHQVRYTCLGDFCLCHRAISHSNWYQMVGMGDLACKFSRIKSTNMFSMYLQSGVPSHLKIYCSFKMKPHCFHACVCQRWPKTLAVTWRNIGFCDVFMLYRQGKYIRGLSYLETWFFKTVIAVNDLSDSKFE